MPKTIQQSVTLPAPAADLYRMYLDPRRHAAIHRRPGKDRRATRDTIPRVQRRALAMLSHTARADDRPDLALNGLWPDGHRLDAHPHFWPRGKTGRIRLVHVNVADRDARGVTEGWRTHYWKPWRAYLRKQRKR